MIHQLSSTTPLVKINRCGHSLPVWKSGLPVDKHRVRLKLLMARVAADEPDLPCQNLFKLLRGIETERPAENDPGECQKYCRHNQICGKWLKTPLRRDPSLSPHCCCATSG